MMHFFDLAERGRGAACSYLPLTNFLGCFLNPSKINYSSHLELKNQDGLEVPKLKKGSIIKWIESFKLHCSNVVGVRNCPIVYVINERNANTLRPALATNQPHSEEYRSVESELVKLLSWDHLLFNNDNNNVFDRM